MNLDQKLSFIIIVAIIIACVSVVYLIISPIPGERFTEFYILGPEGKAGNYPTNLTTEESGELIIGIVNHEKTPSSYQVVVKLNDTILKNETINLKNDEKKEIKFNFQMNQSGNEQKLEFLLYKLPNTLNPYRQLDLVVNVT
ncbi:MAG: DUF1616 domain-containing protein [Methanobacterium sp.]|nr:DUF1616 domain-containing protein [Methanobacterium sp.]